MKALIIVNSKNNRSTFSHSLFEVTHELAKQMYDVEIAFTMKKDDLYKIVQDKIDDISLLVVAGGDGTMYEVTNALKSANKNPKIMYFPTGTVNDFGASLKIPNNFKQQLNILKKQNTMKVDIGLVNGCYFNYICAFGPFTRASYTTSHTQKNKFGRLAYYMQLIKEVPALSKSYYMDICIDNQQIEGYFTYALIINSTSVGGFRHFLKQDSLNDGYFNLILVKKTQAKTFTRGLKYLINGLKDEMEDDVYFFRKFKELSIKTNDRLRWTLDGEKGPKGSIDIKVIKDSLEIYVP